jgi:hypothetical protein
LTPTGAVEFYDGSTDLGHGTALSGSGNAATSTFTISTLNAGSHTIQAVYTNSDGNFTGSSGTLSETINPAGPITLTVTNTNDSGPGSLRAAIATSANGDTIVFAPSLAEQTITLVSTLTVSNSLTITGLGARQLFISGNNQVAVFHISDGSQNVSLSGVTIEYGMASSGGGIYNGATLTVSNCTFSNNAATNGYGGGIYNFYGTLTVDSCTFSNNSAANGEGGGLYNYYLFGSAGTAQVTNSTFTGNSVSGNSATSGNGGAIRNYGQLTITDSTLSANLATLGGGIHNTGTVTSTNCTFSGNSGGGISNAGSLTLVNTIVANSAGGDVLNSSSLIGNNNLIPSGTGLGGLTGTITADPLLGPLQNNGGPTLTMALLPGSPAIQAGNNSGVPAGVTTDQRGFARIVNGTVDIGAFESRGFTIAISSGDNQSTEINRSFAQPLAVMVSSAYGEPVLGGVITFTTSPSGASASFPNGNTATINASGQASLSAQANGTAGSYTVTATATGVMGSVTFHLTNAQANPTVSVTDAGGTYNGSPFPATDSALAMDGKTQVAGTWVNTYYAGSTPTGTPLTGPPINAGSYSVVASFTSSDPNYTNATGAPYTFTISPAPLTITAKDTSKSYGITITFAGTEFTTNGLLNSDTVTSVTLTSAGAAVGAQVMGSPYSITPSAAIGTGLGNYSITYANGQLTVNPAVLTITATGMNKGYDGTPTATVTLSDNRVAGDVFTDNYTSATYADKKVGSGKTITVSGISISGTAAGNYTFNSTAMTTGAITPLALTVSATGVNKDYDGTKTAMVTLSDNRVPGDMFSDSYTTATFADKNAGTGKTVTVAGLAISGPDAGNYTVNATATTTATIMPLAVTGSITVANKVYDATPAAKITSRTLTGVLSGDTVSYAGGTATFSDKNVGTAKTVTATGLSLSGASAGNYTVNSTATTTANITPAPLTIAAKTNTKTYDATTSAAAIPAVAGKQPGDTVTGLTEAYADPNVGTVKALTVTAYTLNDGNAGNNYTVTLVPYPTGRINPAPLTVKAANASRVYGIANPVFTGTIKGIQGTDPITATYSSLVTSASPPGTYANAITPSLADGGTGILSNYTVTSTNGTLTITAAPLSATGVAFQATAGAPFSGTVATFQNADPFGTATSYTATITWGDGNSSGGTITDQGGGLFAVSGLDTYASPNSYAVSVLIKHKLGYTSQATAASSATVASLGIVVQQDQAGSIAFWSSNKGQALLSSFNGGAGSTMLANWLARTFPNLYGATAGSDNLTAQTNSRVAAFYETLFGSPNPKVDAEVLATALNVYATTLLLGGTAAQAYGFQVDAYGLGADSFNVGSNGAAFGVTNNTTLNVYQLLLATNKKAVNGVLYNGNSSLRSQAFNVFDAINNAGGILRTDGVAKRERDLNPTIPVLPFWHSRQQ